MSVSFQHSLGDCFSLNNFFVQIHASFQRQLASNDWSTWGYKNCSLHPNSERTLQLQGILGAWSTGDALQLSDFCLILPLLLPLHRCKSSKHSSVNSLSAYLHVVGCLQGSQSAIPLCSHKMLMCTCVSVTTIRYVCIMASVFLYVSSLNFPDGPILLLICQMKLRRG